MHRLVAGLRLPAAARAGALLGPALLVALALGLAAPASTAQRPVALPDTVLARLPHRDLTVRGVRDSWQRLEPRYRPQGDPANRNREFLQQLIEKEAMARAALAEPFTMTEVESARFDAYRAQLERTELFRILISDSATVTPADRDSARAHMTAMPDGSPTPPEAVEAAARPYAEQRRAGELNQRVRDQVSPVWDDSVAADLARAYAALDPRLPDLSNPMNAHLPNRLPALSAADSARVLATSGVGPLTVAEYVGRFLRLNPFEAALPTTPDAVRARGEQFLGQMWFDAEVTARNLAGHPAVRAALAQRRESIALDHWYARHVASAVDTSQATLRAAYDADPDRYAVRAHAVLSHLPVPTEATADSIVRALDTGTPWDSLCARYTTSSRAREACSTTTSIAADAPDSALVARLAAMAPGEAFARAEPGGVARVIRLVEQVPTRRRSFEEARAFVVRDVQAQQAEKILTTRMAELVKAMPVRINERALAGLQLEP